MRTRSCATEVENEAALYALGALPSAEAAKFGRRVAAGCPLCSTLVADCERVVNLLPLAAPEAAPPPGLRAKLLDRIAGSAKPAAGEGILVRADESEWVDAPAPGVQYRLLHGRNTMLVRMAPNTWLPEHDHAFAEQCLVLEGSIRSDEMTARAGDYVFMPKGSHHPPLYSESGATFLIAYSAA